ncbi:hypothetical protein [Oscillatoria acuminata]|uniref:hypothetical protein n=1 Tax=Oscillatoria acuminata TaxID=118323 RepID=UPI0012EAFE61|nr:hypothetical protein [Oscillatoria acuminata]
MIKPLFQLSQKRWKDDAVAQTSTRPQWGSRQVNRERVFKSEWGVRKIRLHPGNEGDRPQWKQSG